MMHVKLSDQQWERIRHHFPEESRSKGRRGQPMVSARRVFEETVHPEIQAWVRAGVLDRVLEDLAGEAKQRGLFDGPEAYVGRSCGRRAAARA